MAYSIGHMMPRSLKALVFAICLPFVACSSAPDKASTPTKPSAASEEPVPVLRSGEDTLVFRNDTGTKITLVPVSVGSEDRFLVELRNMETELAKAILIATRGKNSLGGTRFAVSWHGREFGVLHGPREDGRGSWQIYHPEDVRDGVKVYRDDAAAKDVDGAKLLATHLDQRKDGIYSQVTRFDRAWHENKNSEKLAQSVDTAAAACGSFQATIDWSTVDDESLASDWVYQYCRATVEELGTLCKRAPHAREKVKNAGKLRCAFAGKPGEKVASAGLTKDSNGLVLTPHDDNLWEHAHSDVANLFDEKVFLLRLGDGHVLVNEYAKEDGSYGPKIWAGNGDTLYEQPLIASSAGDFLSWAGAYRASLEQNKEDGSWQVTCGERKRPLQAVYGDERKNKLASLKLEAPKWKRTAYALARDSRGIYYYVDAYSQKHGGKHYRVFIGKRGQMKLSKLKGVVDDSKGTVFATNRGDLRLIIDTAGPRAATWIRGKGKPVQLSPLPLGENRKLIYEELGAYLGEELGHICEL